MPLQRFIPALTTLGVVAGLAAARMVVEVLPFGQAAEAFSAWVHDAPEQAPKPTPAPGSGVAATTAATKPGARRVVSVIKVESSPDGCPAMNGPQLWPQPLDPDHPTAPGTVPTEPVITNGIAPRELSERWIGA